MISIRPYQKGDEAKGEWKTQHSVNMSRLFRENPGATILDGDKPILIIGAAPMWKDTVQVYALSSVGASRRPVRMTRILLTMARTFFGSLGARKIYVIVDSSRPQDVRFNEWLGFTHEYTMKEAGPDKQDMLGYSYVLGTDYQRGGRI